MKIWHRISFDRRYEQVLRRLGIDYEKGITPASDYSSVVFSIHEDDPAWPEIDQLVRELDCFNMVWTRFTEEEILACEWVRLCPGFEKGYPQPERNMQYAEKTYGWTCRSCGLESEQKAAFRIKKELGMGRQDFVTLYWTYSILCTQRVVRKIQEADLHGVEIWPVVLHSRDVPSAVLSQLVFPTVAKPGLDPRDKDEPEYCGDCGITKYGYHSRGYMHIRREALHEDADAQLTSEWFGSDTKTGHREILISNRFARLILAEGWRGVSLKGVILV